MKKQSSGAEDWIDGFLFVGNQIALDLLNTRLTPDGTTSVELLSDTDALQTWLIAAGLLSAKDGEKLAHHWKDSAEALAFLEELQAFRENLRVAVIKYETGEAIPASFLSDLNRLLQEYPTHFSLSYKEGVLLRETAFEPSAPADIWAPIIAATADLLSQVESTRVRQCESCIVHFQDVSKKNSRRWCSMNLCGNRIKVAAYQQRQRARSAE